MSDDDSIGARVRERRLALGFRQAELAEKVGISASYLNLIEHNRRRIAGKILIALANELSINTAMLSEGAQASIVGRLKESAGYHAKSFPQVDKAADFATRFPHWADLVVQLDRRVRDLEQSLDTLNDRLSHDPHLATSLHEVLTTVTAIRSTSGILADMQDIEPEWRNRFHRNLNEDSSRLADGAQALVSYLDNTSRGNPELGTPWDEFSAFVTQEISEFTDPEKFADPSFVIEHSHVLKSRVAKGLAQKFLYQVYQDLRILPQAALVSGVSKIGIDLLPLASFLDVPVPVLMRRLACSPKADIGQDVGLVSCDASGSFILRRTIDGFHVPRFGSACSLWPLFSSLHFPKLLRRHDLTHTGREGGSFRAWSFADTAQDETFTPSPRIQSYMLVVPLKQNEVEQTMKVGAACRVCAIEECPARREPSILGHQEL